MKQFIVILVILLSSMLLFGKDAQPVTDMKTEAEFALISVPKLNKAEINGILLMREEEKMAHDVYAFFEKKFDIPIFRNIARSETRHQQSMLWLIENYGLKDPAKDDFGKFSNKELQKLYDKFTGESVTLIESLQAGAYIEEYDIADLRRLISETENQDIIRIYSNLLRASENHLRVFVRNLSFRQTEYHPKVLDIKQFCEIIDN